MLCLEVWREFRVEESRGEERRVVGRRRVENSYPSPYLNVFKIKRREE